MAVTPSMVEFVLREEGLDAKVVGNPSCEIEGMHAYAPGDHAPGVLYVHEGKFPRRAPSSSGPFAVLLLNPEDSVPVVPEGGQSQGRGATAMLERAYAALRKIDLWESRLKDALLRRASFDEFIELGSSMFSCPLAYFDRNLITLASSEDYWQRSEAARASSAGLHVDGQMPSELAVDLVEDFDYLHAAEKQEPFYYESAQNQIFYGINTFDNGEYLARLVLALPVGKERLHPGEELLAALYHHYLYELHLLYAGNAEVASSQNDALHALVRSVAIGGETVGAAELASVLSSFGWAGDDDFVTAKLVFFEGVHWDTISLYLCGLLERAMGASCAFPLGRAIVWTVNLTRSSKRGESADKRFQRLLEALVSIMRDYACKAGISDAYGNLVHAHAYYLEAERALEIGQIRDPHYWYYRFSDYAFDYLVAKSTEEFSGKQLCHPALAALISYDAANSTDYARTLVCYLRNSGNTTHAASELFIHRTSFMRRMGHIAELTGIDLDDSDTVLHLLLSAKLIGM